MTLAKPAKQASRTIASKSKLQNAGASQIKDMARSQSPQGGSKHTSTKEPFLPREISGGLDYTLVLDLDETLVHFDQVSLSALMLQRLRNYRPRPGVHKFLQEMSSYYELVVFTAGLKDYADWILNDFDRHGLISYRLYRHHTRFRSGVYVKDLSKLGRNLQKTIIIDNI